MTAAFNLAQLGNNVNTSGQVALSTGVSGTLAIANGGTNATTAATARTNLGLGTLATVTPSGTGSSSTWLRGDNAWATLPDPTTNQVLNATAGLTAGGVGTYIQGLALVYPIAFGDTTSGSNILPCSAVAQTTSGSVTGTWRCMGDVGALGGNQRTTVFVRVA